MSIIKTGLFLAVVVMLLPVEERKQVELASTASTVVQQTASFCDRNPSTCATGRELWVLFVRKAEYGMELGAKLVRDQLVGSPAEPPAPMRPAVQMPAGLQLPPPGSGRPPASERQAARFEPVRGETTPKSRAGFDPHPQAPWR